MRLTSLSSFCSAYTLMDRARAGVARAILAARVRDRKRAPRATLDRSRRPLQRIGPFVELDRGAPRIVNEGELGAARLGHDRPVELDALRLELLGESDQILHVEADVIEHVPGGRYRRRIGFRERQLGARNVGGLKSSARADGRAEMLDIPGLDLGDRGFRNVVVDMVMPDRDRLAPVLQDLDLQPFARRDPRLIGAAVGAGRDVDAGSFPFGDCGGHVWYVEADMIDHGPDRAADRRRRAGTLMQEDDDAWKLHDLEVAWFRRDAAEGDEQLLVGLDVARVEVPVAHGHAEIVRRSGLRESSSGCQGRDQSQCCKQPSHRHLSHDCRLLVLSRAIVVNAITPPARAVDAGFYFGGSNARSQAPAHAPCPASRGHPRLEAARTIHGRSREIEENFMSVIRVGHTELLRFFNDIFRAKGMRAEDAATVAEVLLWANLRGVDSHGAMRIPHYLDQIRKGAFDPTAQPRLRPLMPATFVLDCARAAGPVCMMRAAARAIEIAETFGVGVGLVSDTAHTGAVGRYAQWIAERGFAALVMVAGPLFMAYHGAKVTSLGTSPLAIGIPGPDGDDPLVLDMAT